MNSEETNTKNSGQQEESSSVLGFLWDLFKIFVIALIITAPFRLFVAQPFVVSGSSMVPNFHDRDYLIVDRWTYRSSEPQRGEVIVFKYPKDTSVYYIKRVIGLPGETVKLLQGHVVIINKEHPEGLVLNESYLPSQIETSGVVGGENGLTLGSGEYFVLGDNRLASSDSRVWGVLPKDDIIGRVFLRILPLKQFGIIRAASY